MGNAKKIISFESKVKIWINISNKKNVHTFLTYLGEYNSIKTLKVLYLACKLREELILIKGLTEVSQSSKFQDNIQSWS